MKIEDLIREGRELADAALDGRLGPDWHGDPDSHVCNLARIVVRLLDALEAALTDLRSLETEGSARQRIRFANENDALRSHIDALRTELAAERVMGSACRRDYPILEAEVLALRRVADAARVYRDKVDFTGGDSTEYFEAEQNVLDDALAAVPPRTKETT